MATITLDRERRVTFKWSALRRLKKEYGINLFRLVETGDEQNWLDPDTLTYVLWAGLLDEEPELQPSDVDAMLELRDLGKVLEVINAELLAAFQTEPAAEDPTIGPSGTSSAVPIPTA